MNAVTKKVITGWRTKAKELADRAESGVGTNLQTSRWQAQASALRYCADELEEALR